MKHKRYIYQDEEKDCGVVCLYNIIKDYGGHISINKLRNMLNTNKNGTSVYDIVKTSNQLGLDTSAYKCELNDLHLLNFPIIAHIKIDEKYNHFIIINEMIDDEIVIFDPIRGYIKYNLEEFEKEWTNIVITFKKTSNIVKEKENNILKKLFKYLYNNSLLIIIVFFLSILSTFLSIIHSLYLSFLYDNSSIYFSIFIKFILICIIKLIIDFIRNNLILKYTKKFDIAITNNVYNKILSLPISFHHLRPIGDIISRMNDISNIKQFINILSFSFIIDLMYILLICIILFTINKVMFILLFILISIYLLIYLLYRNNIVNMSYKVKETSSSFNSFLIDSLLGIDTIKNLNIENHIKDKFKNVYNKFLDSKFKLNKTIINFENIESFICNISCVIVIFICLVFFKNNLIKMSNIITFNSLIIYLYMSIKNIISLDEVIIEAKNSYKRIDSLLYNNSNTSLNNKIDSIKKINFNNLNYSYNNINNIIDNINFTINKGDYIYVSGQSGSGKSTIFKLLTKQLNCNKKMITINNIDINEISKENIVDNICYVSQNEYIFTDNILNNILLYKDANKRTLEKVIKITGIDKMLKKRNISLDFLLEENAHNISGGERQRIILARSLLQGKKVLILDETMNELDIKSERDIISNIKKEFNITLILISHRDNNSDLFNKIIKLPEV